jgi:hypothetical protein
MRFAASILAIVAVVFAGFALRDFVDRGKLSIAARIWLRMVVIFSAAALLLAFAV